MTPSDGKDYHAGRLDEIAERLARMEQKIDDIGPRCENHAKRIDECEVALAGDKEHPGVFEMMRAHDARLKWVAAGLSAAVAFGFELAKEKVKKMMGGP